MRIPLMAFILQGIPECMAIMTLAFVLAGIKLEWKRIALYGFILALATYFVRLLPITFGTHTIILMGFVFILLIYYFQVPIFTAFKASLVSYLCLIIAEYTCISLFSTLFNLSFEVFLTDVTTRILATLPQVFILFIIAFVIFKVRTERRMK